VIIVNFTIKERVFVSIAIFVVGFVCSFILDYLFRPSNIDLIRYLSISFGLAIGMAFGDVIFSAIKRGIKKRK
jgi:hypothetical protein